MAIDSGKERLWKFADRLIWHKSCPEEFQSQIHYQNFVFANQVFVSVNAKGWMHEEGIKLWIGSLFETALEIQNIFNNLKLISIRSTSDQHQINIRSISDQHQISIRSASDQHQINKSKISFLSSFSLLQLNWLNQLKVEMWLQSKVL